MAETDQEQIEMGGYCVPHGNPIGTPGGADIMCHECEMGLTRWVEDPIWALRVGPERGEVNFTTFLFRQSEYDNPSVATLRRMAKMKRFLMMFGTEDVLETFTYEMHRVQGGYWAEE